jgi:galactose-1-phosphate uridylyltransferase
MSELRQDIVSGDWVIVAPGRAARPKFLDEKKKKTETHTQNWVPF